MAHSYTQQGYSPYSSSQGSQSYQPLSYPTRSYADAVQGQYYQQTSNASVPGANPMFGNSEVMLWFQAVDVDQSGKITAQELRQALANTNWSLFSEDSCRLMISMFDQDESKTIDINEFQQLWGYLQQWHNVFNQVDQNRSGYIEQEELQQALTSMGYQFSPSFLQVAITRFDYTNQKRISLDGFIVCCVILHQLTESFKQHDTERSGQVKVDYDNFLIMAFSGIP